VELELESEPRQSDRVLMVASLSHFPNDNFHLLSFSVAVVVGIDYWHRDRWVGWYIGE